MTPRHPYAEKHRGVSPRTPSDWFVVTALGVKFCEFFSVRPQPTRTFLPCSSILRVLRRISHGQRVRVHVHLRAPVCRHSWPLQLSPSSALANRSFVSSHDMFIRAYNMPLPPRRNPAGLPKDLRGPLNIKFVPYFPADLVCAFHDHDGDRTEEVCAYSTYFLCLGRLGTRCSARTPRASRIRVRLYLLGGPLASSTSTHFISLT